MQTCWFHVEVEQLLFINDSISIKSKLWLSYQSGYLFFTFSQLRTDIDKRRRLKKIASDKVTLSSSQVLDKKNKAD